MGKINDLTGKQFNRLIVDSFSHVNDKRRAVFNCVCRCTPNKLIPVLGVHLQSKGVQSCGCLLREKASATAKEYLGKGERKTHGKSKTLIYSRWAAIKQRCYNFNHDSYENYGGRGIKMCPEWEENFQAFYDYIGEPPSSDYSIERINRSEDYKPGNVKWSKS